jgi:hypothetical protein
MAFAVAFTLIGKVASASTATKDPVAKVTDVQIVLGGGIGTVLLVLLSEMGETAATLARGLAGITLLGSVLVNGKPVFALVSTMTTATSSPTNATLGSPATVNYPSSRTSYMPPLSTSKGTP